MRTSFKWLSIVSILFGVLGLSGLAVAGTALVLVGY